MSAGGKTFLVSGYLPDAFHADGTLKDEHRCPLCPAPGEGITIDLSDLGDPAYLGELQRLLARPAPPARGRSRGKRRRKRR
jgi:hypothetical protein